MLLDLSTPPPADLHSIPREIVVKDGRGKPLGDPQVALSLVGCYSQRYTNAQREAAVNAVRRLKTSDEKELAQSLAAEDRGLDVLVACVVGWRNVIEGGSPAPCTPDRVRILLKGYPFVRDQVESFVHGDRNFTQGESPSSSSGPSGSSPSTTAAP